MSESRKFYVSRGDILRRCAPGLGLAKAVAVTSLAILNTAEQHDASERAMQAEAVSRAHQFTEILNSKGATDGVVEGVLILPGFVSFRNADDQEAATAVNPLILSGKIDASSAESVQSDLDGVRFGISTHDASGKIMIVPILFDQSTASYAPGTPDNFKPQEASIYTTEIAQKSTMLVPFDPTGEVNMSDYFPTSYVGQYVSDQQN